MDKYKVHKRYVIQRGLYSIRWYNSDFFPSSSFFSSKLPSYLVPPFILLVWQARLLPWLSKLNSEFCESCKVIREREMDKNKVHKRYIIQRGLYSIRWYNVDFSPSSSFVFKTELSVLQKTLHTERSLLHTLIQLPSLTSILIRAKDQDQTLSCSLVLSKPNFHFCKKVTQKTLHDVKLCSFKDNARLLFSKLNCQFWKGQLVSSFIPILKNQPLHYSHNHPHTQPVWVFCWRG